jgi:NADPH2:quinone reductase
MNHAMRIHANGDPGVLVWEEHELPPPPPGHVQVRHTAISVNFSDVNVRRGGFYIAEPLQFPVVLGNEGAGVVAAVGDGVTGFEAGDRVAYVGSGGPFYEDTGSYAEARNLLERCVIKLPGDISEQTAAALLLKGLTASLVIQRLHTPQPGEWILIHAAASGVGLLLSQWSHHLGATVIGTVGSPAKAAIARSHGCAHPVLYREVDFVGAVKQLVPEGVHAVFDGVGKDTLEKSLDCMRPFAILVNYGNASGHPDPLDLLLLAKKGSLRVARPAFNFHIRGRERYETACNELFDLVRAGVLKVEIAEIYPLRDAAQAHRDLEAGRHSGSVLLAP